MLLGAGWLESRAAQQRTVWDGVYTEVQAKRGARAYGRYCASCHGRDLSGGIDGAEQAPALKRDGFLLSRRDLGNAFTYISEWMPRDEPGTLPRRMYADVLAYLLEQNGFPSGSGELPFDPTALGRIVIVPKP